MCIACNGAPTVLPLSIIRSCQIFGVVTVLEQHRGPAFRAGLRVFECFFERAFRDNVPVAIDVAEDAAVAGDDSVVAVVGFDFEGTIKMVHDVPRNNWVTANE
jgi:hypothetical protein